MPTVHKIAKDAEDSGLLIRPDSCEKCGDSERKLCKHHPDYSKPLEVEWVCYPCHRKLHLANKKLRNPKGPELRARAKEKRSTLEDRVFKARLKMIR